MVHGREFLQGETECATAQWAPPDILAPSPKPQAPPPPSKQFPTRPTLRMNVIGVGSQPSISFSR